MKLDCVCLTDQIVSHSGQIFLEQYITVNFALDSCWQVICKLVRFAHIAKSDLYLQTFFELIKKHVRIFQKKKTGLAVVTVMNYFV